MNILNVATLEELELIKLHIKTCESIGFDTMLAVKRDESDNLCIEYESGCWYHYNATRGEWW